MLLALEFMEAYSVSLIFVPNYKQNRTADHLQPGYPVVQNLLPDESCKPFYRAIRLTGPIPLKFPQYQPGIVRFQRHILSVTPYHVEHRFRLTVDAEMPQHLHRRILLVVTRIRTHLEILQHQLRLVVPVLRAPDITSVAVRALLFRHFGHHARNTIVETLARYHLSRTLHHKLP